MGFAERSELLLGEESTSLLASKHVALFGLGGVGGAALEALARSGIGEFTLVDADTFVSSNLNRQLLATQQTLGKDKVEVGKERILSINPDAVVHTVKAFVLPENVSSLTFASFDFVIDAIDTISAKMAIIIECSKTNVPVISCMGCGNRLDPSKLRVCDLFDTSYDPLAKVMRKKCRDAGIASLPVVTSLEEAAVPLKRIQAEGPTRRDVPGSTPFVPPVAGYLLAQYAVLALLKQ